MNKTIKRVLVFLGLLLIISFLLSLLFGSLEFLESNPNYIDKILNSLCFILSQAFTFFAVGFILISIWELTNRLIEKD
jgi:hypothetical protein